MRPIVVLVAVLATAALASSTPAVAGSSKGAEAQAAARAAHTHNCVTRREYRRVENGMRKGEVHRIFDFPGRQVSLEGNVEVRQYRVCDSWNDAPGAHVRVVYQNGKVVAKMKSW